MKSFALNGRSRQNQMTLARDHRPTRESIIADAQQARQKREKERQRLNAAQRLQRAVRLWQAVQRATELCLARLDRTAASLRGPTAAAPQPSSSPAVRSSAETNHGRGSSAIRADELETAVFCLRYLQGHTGQIPRASLLKTWSASHPHMASTAYERAVCERHLLGHYTGVLFQCAQHFLFGLTSPTAGATSSTVATTAAAALASPSARHVLGSLSSQSLVFLTESFIRELFGMTKAAAVMKSTTTATVSQSSPTHTSPSESCKVSVQAPWQQTARSYTVDDVVRLLGIFAEIAEATSSTRWAVGATVLRCVAEAGAANNATEAARCALLRPFRGLIEHGLVDLFPTPPLLTNLSTAAVTAAAVNEEAEEATSPTQDTKVSAADRSGEVKDALREQYRAAWASAVWSCLTNTTWPQENMSLTTDGLAALWSLTEAEGDVRTSSVVLSTAICAALFSIAAAVIAPGVPIGRTTIAASTAALAGVGTDTGPSRALSSLSSAAAAVWRWSPAEALEALGRLTRLLPCVQSTSPDTTTSRPQNASLPESVRQEWLLCVSKLTEQLCTTEAFMTHILFDLHHSRTAASTAASPTRSRSYRYLISYLFSSEGGLQLLTDYGTAAMRIEASQGQSDSDATDEARATLTSLELCSSIFAWPLFTFSMSEESTHRLETAALFAKLARTPALLRQLWGLYRDRSPSLRKILVESPTGLSTRLEMAERKASPGVAAAATLPGADPPASVLNDLPRSARVIRHLFYDPSPALSVLFFALLSYYVDVTDFEHDLQRGTVLRLRECTALILALKDIVHRAHLSGVVPGYSSEAVAHVAFILLAKLHAVNESTPFVTSPAVWVSVTDATHLRPLGELSPGRWEELTMAYHAEVQAVTSELARRRRRQLRSHLDGADGSGVDEEDEEERPDAVDEPVNGAGTAKPKRRRSVLRAQNEEVVATRGTISGAPSMDTHVTSPTASSALCLPGEDPLFARSCFWHTDERIFRLLLHVPFMVPFAERSALLTTLLMNQPVGRPLDAGEFVVRRGSAFMDTYEKFRDCPDSPSMFAVRFRDANNMLEPGYGQGVYRELMGEVCKEGFSAEHGLFKQTVEGDLYPNPFSWEATNDPDHLRKIHFLGTMAGRAIRDGILQDVPFAHHFRNALLGRTNSINNLRQYDAELCGRLLSLLTLSEAEVDSLELTFTYTVNALGVTRDAELIRDGASVRVTRRNCLHYIHLVADFKLNREAAPQTRAFQQGLERIVDPTWLRLFDTAELNKLLCGEPGKMDIEDWRRHTVYHTPEQANDPAVNIFWGVVESLNAKQQSQLLQFSTAMKHPPLFGFRFLSPPFKIQLVPNESEDRLPSAATCFSTLKLPPYKTFEMARTKIVAAIEETNSFGFS